MNERGIPFAQLVMTLIVPGLLPLLLMRQTGLLWAGLSVWLPAQVVAGAFWYLLARHATRQVVTRHLLPLADLGQTRALVFIEALILFLSGVGTSLYSLEGARMLSRRLLGDGRYLSVLPFVVMALAVYLASFGARPLVRTTTALCVPGFALMVAALIPAGARLQPVVWVARPLVSGAAATVLLPALVFPFFRLLGPFADRAGLSGGMNVDFSTRVVAVAAVVTLLVGVLAASVLAGADYPGIALGLARQASGAAGTDIGLLVGFALLVLCLLGAALGLILAGTTVMSLLKMRFSTGVLAVVGVLDSVAAAFLPFGPQDLILTTAALSLVSEVLLASLGGKGQ